MPRIPRAPGRKPYTYRKSHLVHEEQDGWGICGRRAYNKDVQTVQDFKDFGFDGDASDLCEHCTRKLELIEGAEDEARRDQ